MKGPEQRYVSQQPTRYPEYINLGAEAAIRKVQTERISVLKLCKFRLKRCHFWHRNLPRLYRCQQTNKTGKVNQPRWLSNDKR